MIYSGKGFSRGRVPCGGPATGLNRMKLRSSLILAAVLAVLAGLAGAIYNVAVSEKKGDTHLPVLPEGVQAALEGKTRISSTENGSLAWTMTCEGLMFHEAEKSVRVTSPMAIIPVEEGGTVEVTGASGGYFQDTEDMEIEDGVRVSMTKSGLHEWMVEGDTASYRKGPDTFYIGSPRGAFFLESGETVDITGKKGSFHAPSGDMHLEGDVLCSIRGGMSLRTGRLVYRSKENVAVSDDNVHIEGKGYVLDGRGLFADMGRERVIIDRGVQLRLEKGFGK